MKKNILIIVLISFCSFYIYSQIPVTNTIAVESETFLDCTPGTYLKDINGIYIPYLGNWSWTNGNEKITFTFKKITQYYWAKYHAYGDFIVADYKYTNANGIVIIDTSLITNGSTNIKDYKMFSAGINDDKFPFSFKDVVISKSGRIIFTLNNTNPNQMSYKLENFGQSLPVGTPFVTDDFSIPDNITVTKE